MVPIEAPELKPRILTEIVPTYLRDNTRARVLLADGSYARANPDGQVPHRSQEEFLTLRSGAREAADTGNGDNGAPIEHVHAPPLQSGS
jgi:hypothetical protein